MLQLALLKLPLTTGPGYPDNPNQSEKSWSWQMAWHVFFFFFEMPQLALWISSLRGPGYLANKIFDLPIE